MPANPLYTTLSPLPACTSACVTSFFAFSVVASLPKAILFSSVALESFPIATALSAVAPSLFSLFPPVDFTEKYFTFPAAWIFFSRSVESTFTVTLFPSTTVEALIEPVLFALTFKLPSHNPTFGVSPSFLSPSIFIVSDFNWATLTASVSSVPAAKPTICLVKLPSAFPTETAPAFKLFLGATPVLIFPL